MIQVKDLTYKVGHKTILSPINTCFLPGKLNLILGPNGSGKSTLIKLLSGDLMPLTGQILYDDINIKSIQKNELASFRAVLSQQTELSFPMNVEEVVMLGRTPHYDFTPTIKDFETVKQAIELLDIQFLINRNYQTLSGGEKQRVQFARVLCQLWDTPINGYRYLLLDEPLNSLDIKYQQQFLKIIQSFLNDKTVLVGVVHDINLAIRFADQLYFIHNGALVAKGSPLETIQPQLIEEVFNIATEVILNPLNSQPLVLYK
jgi:iron complex transport system ATP-binding protein